MGFNACQGQKIFLSTKITRLGPTQLPVPCVSHSVVLMWGVNRGMKFTTNIHVGWSLRMGGDIPLLYIINVMECIITTSVFSHIGVVSMLPAEDIAPCIIFQDLVREGRIF